MDAAHSAERLQKVLSQLGLASRREAEAWIRAGRLSVNGRPAVLGMRVGPADQLRLDGRPIRQRPGGPIGTVFLCHRSPGAPLQLTGLGPGASADLDAGSSIAARLPRRAGRRFISVSPMPRPDGGLELLTADGALGARLQRVVHTAETEFNLRVRGELTPLQEEGIRGGELDRGVRLPVTALEACGGEGSNRWYRLIVTGASGNEVRQLFERQAVTVVRVLRTRLGTLSLPRELSRGRWRELQPEEVDAFLTGRAPRAPAAQHQADRDSED
jgi:23S rRNA pseudouridine2605 synthase